MDAFLTGVADRYARSMRQRIDLDAIWTRALGTVTRYFPDEPRARALPRDCPWSLEDLPANDHAALLAALPDSPRPPDCA